MDQYLISSSSSQSLTIDMTLINSIPTYSVNEFDNNLTLSPSFIFEKSFYPIDDNFFIRQEHERNEHEQKKLQDEKQKKSWIDYAKEMLPSNSPTLKFFENEIEEIFFVRRFDKLNCLQEKIDNVYHALISQKH